MNSQQDADDDIDDVQIVVINTDSEDFSSDDRISNENGEPAKTLAIEYAQDNDNNESVVENDQTCSICFEKWTNVGYHRICTLKCGHLFGRSCVEHWLRSNVRKISACPQCNKKASKHDIINLYTSSIQPVDYNIVENIRKELEDEKASRIKLETDFSNMNVRLKMWQTEIELLRNENNRLKRKISTLTENSVAPNINLSDSPTYVHQAAFPICRQDGCRILNVHPSNKLVLISKNSENPTLFPGSGICKLSLDNLGRTNYKREFVRLHETSIRDMDLSLHDSSLLLTSSFDKTLKISSILSDSTVLQYQLNCPSWSCHWDQRDSNIVYSGLANGTLLVFDIRNTSDPIHRISLYDNDRSNVTPIVSIKTINLRESNVMPDRGLIVATFDKLFFIENTVEYEKHHILDPPGNVIHINTDHRQEFCIVSLRSRSKSSTCDRMIGTITETLIEGDRNENTPQIMFSLQNMVKGGQSSTYMSRSVIFSPEPSELCVAFGNEDSQSVIHSFYFDSN